MREKGAKFLLKFLLIDEKVINKLKESKKKGAEEFLKLNGIFEFLDLKKDIKTGMIKDDSANPNITYPFKN